MIRFFNAFKLMHTHTYTYIHACRRKCPLQRLAIKLLLFLCEMKKDSFIGHVCSFQRPLLFHIAVCFFDFFNRDSNNSQQGRPIELSEKESLANDRVKQSSLPGRQCICGEFFLSFFFPFFSRQFIIGEFQSYLQNATQLK